MSSDPTPASREVTLIPGDGTGPEVCAAVQELCAALQVPIRWDEVQLQGDQISESVLESARRTGVVLKAKLAFTPRLGRLPPTVALRKQLNAWATVRPVRAIPGLTARFPDIDVIVIRETSEDIYSGLEHEITDGVWEAVKVTTRPACERIARFAFDYARRKGRKKVTVVHKSNIMKKADGLFLNTALQVARDYPDIAVDDVIVDALCMRLVKRPNQFDVLLAGNLFGDIVSDLCTGLAGGHAAGASYSVGDGIYIFEQPYADDPALAGTGKANPLPMIASSAFLLRYLEHRDAAQRMMDGVSAALADGLVPSRDGCAATVSAIRAHL
jgi:isocitrate dehydrogenase (NAD+)